MKFKAACLVVLVAGLVHAEDKAKVKDKDRLPGTWLVVGLSVDGREEAIEEQKFKFIFAADKVTVVTPKKQDELEFSWAMDDSTNPRILDLTGTKGAQKDQVFEGIYKFDKDTLIICVRGPQGLRERPTEFASKEGTNLVLIRLERVK